MSSPSTATATPATVTPADSPTDTATTSIEPSPSLTAFDPIAPPPVTSMIKSIARIQCWGHRGASAHLPENTLASFRAAILEGAEGIESDVHVTTDGVILMFHDPTLDRTTNGKGAIKEQAWTGAIEHVRTTKPPIQPIPRLDELVALIMEPENRHVVLNIDCKIQNDPDILFPLIAKIISAYPNYETELAPRLILGLWHPLFLLPAKRHLPALTRFHIGISFDIARKYFWSDCVGFSMAFPMLVSSDGQAFLRECKDAGKAVTVWTVNDREEMIVSAGWGVKAVLTDKVAHFVSVRQEFEENPSKLHLPITRRIVFPWTSWKYYTLSQLSALKLVETKLTTQAYLPGRFEEVLQLQQKISAEADPIAVVAVA